MEDEKEFNHVMKIDLQVHEVEEILESREDLEVQAVIHRAVKTEVEDGSPEVDHEAGQESRNSLRAEDPKEDHPLVVLHLVPEVETEVELEVDPQVVQGEGERNLIQEVAKDLLEKTKRVDLEAQVVNGKNRHSQIDQDPRQRNEMQSNSEKVRLLLER